MQEKGKGGGTYARRGCLPPAQIVPALGDQGIYLAILDPMDANKLRLLVRESLESARATVVARLLVHNLPTSIPTEVLVVELGQGVQYETHNEVRQTASINDIAVAKTISPKGLPWEFGIADKLLPLAEFINASTDLASRNEVLAAALPDETREATIVRKFLDPMSRSYLYSLADLAIPDDRAIEGLTKELEQVIAERKPRYRFQLHLSGLLLDETIRDGNVTLRPLNKFELGFLSKLLYPYPIGAGMTEQGLLMPSLPTSSLPTSLIEVELPVDYPFQDGFGDADILHRFVLACSLNGIEIGGTGFMMAGRHPRWIDPSTFEKPSPVVGRFVATRVPMTQLQFTELISLARRMPVLSESSNSNRAIALYRALRGLMARFGEGDGFLDFAIALEALLLAGENSELSFRFAFYGAAFLKRIRLHAETFKSLRTVYRVRSKLVHGLKYTDSDRAEAGRLAMELTQHILLEALNRDWPDANKLGESLLRSMASDESIGI